MPHLHKHSHSSFFSHSHSHSESESDDFPAQIAPNSVATSSMSAQTVALIGLGSNLMMLFLKAGAGHYLHSSALMADALHSATDLVSDLITFFVLKFNSGGQKWPYGTGKVETAASVAVHLSCMMGGIGIAAVALQGMGISLGPLAHVHSHSHSHSHSHGHENHLDHASGADIHAVWFALLGLASKEGLYRLTKKVADETHSPVLLANANHHRSDAWASLIAVLAILGSALAFPALDSIGGILVSTCIIFEACAGMFQAGSEILDRGVDVESYRRKVEAYLKDSATVIAIRGRKSGGLVFLEVTIELIGNSFNKAVQSAAGVKTMLESRGSVGEAVVILQKEDSKLDIRGSARKSQ